AARPRQDRRRDAGMGRRQEAACRKNPPSQGRTGGGSEAAAEAKLKAAAEVEEKREAEGRRKGGRKAAPPSSKPDAKAQKHVTEPESRIMKSKDGFVQAYNAQAAVDGDAQIIVAHDVTTSAGQ